MPTATKGSTARPKRNTSRRSTSRATAMAADDTPGLSDAEKVRADSSRDNEPRRGTRRQMIMRAATITGDDSEPTRLLEQCNG